MDTFVLKEATISKSLEPLLPLLPRFGCEKTFDVPEETVRQSSEVQPKAVLLEDLSELAVNERITMTGKVVAMEDGATVHSKCYGKDNMKQDFTFAD